MLKEAQIDRYARHILLREVGGIGQERLLASTVILHGLEAGGWLVSWLGLAGVGTLVLDDPRPVGPAELAPLLSAADLGRPRDEALAAALPAFNDDVRVVVGKGAPADVDPAGVVLRIRAGLPPAEGADALHYAAIGGHAVVVPPGARPCAACLDSISAGEAETAPAGTSAPASGSTRKAALPSATAASLAGSIAGSEALLHLLGRAPASPSVSHFHRGEPVICTHRL